MSASSITSGIYPPISDGGTAQRIPLAVSWLDGPVVAVGTLVGDAPVTTDPLPEGVYLIWTDGPTWINAGGDDVTVDPAETGHGACWPHEQQWDVSIRDGQRIALRRRARAGSSTDPIPYRIKKVA